MLDAEVACAEAEEVIRVVLGRDPDEDPERAWLAYRSHLARAKWMTRIGYKLLATDPRLPD